MYDYKVNLHTGAQKVVQADGPALGLRKAFPDFRWEFGLQKRGIAPPTFVYSDRSGGWAQVEEIGENHEII